MEVRSSRRMRTLVTQMAHRGLSANEIARALISMMARSTTLQSEAGYIDARPLTTNSTKLSCDARPDHTLGQSRRSHRVRGMSAFAPNSGRSAALPRLIEWRSERGARQPSVQERTPGSAIGGHLLRMLARDHGRESHNSRLQNVVGKDLRLNDPVRSMTFMPTRPLPFRTPASPSLITRRADLTIEAA